MSSNSNLGVYDSAILSPMDSNSDALLSSTLNFESDWLDRAVPIKPDSANVVGCVFIEEIKSPMAENDALDLDNLNFNSAIQFADLSASVQPKFDSNLLEVESEIAPIQKPVRESKDDGYGSQNALYAAGIMDSSVDQDTFDDFDSPFIRDRCNTWPRLQRVLPDETEQTNDSTQFDTNVQYYGRPRYVRHTPFSPTSQHLSHGSSGLSLITESTESLHHLGGAGVCVEPKMGAGGSGWVEKNQNQQQLQYVTGLLSHHSSTGSEASSQSQLTQPRQQQQIQPPVSAGIQMPPPQQQQPVQQQPITPLIGNTNYKAGHPSYVELITQAILSSPEKRMTLSEIYDWMVTNVAAFKDQRYLHSSSGWKNSVRHNLSLHSRFKRVKRNGMDKPSWWTVDLTEETKRERNGKGRGGKQTSTNNRPRANSTTASIYHPPNKPQSAIGRPQVQIHQQQQQSNTPISPNFGSPNVPNLPQSATAKKFLSPKSGMDAAAMDWSQFDNYAQAVTVTLSSPDDQSEFGGNKRKQDIALTVTMGNESGGQLTNLVNQFRQNSLEETSTMQKQLLRIQTSAGHVQQVAVPVPMPIKVVMKADKGCQTMDQGTMTSPTPFMTPASFETISSGFWPLDNTTVKDESGLTDLDIECLTAFGVLGSVNQDIAAIAKELEQSMPMSVPVTGGQQLHQQRQPLPQLHHPHQLQNGHIQMASPNGGMKQMNGMVETLGSGFGSGMSSMLVNGNDPQKIPVSQNMALGQVPTTISTPLPEDLAAVDMNDALDCNIMDILSFEMNNYQQANQAGNKY